MKPVIGLDVGHSAVKVALRHDLHPIVIPSVVCQAIPISDDAERARADQETVVMTPARRYFYGETAIAQGGGATLSGLSENWLDTPEHAVLMMGAWRKAWQRLGDCSNAMLVMGLPTHLFSRQRDKLKHIAKELLDGVGDIRVMPQAMGPYQAFMLQYNGVLNPERPMREQSWGVVEVGHFTTDFALIQQGRWVEKASGVCSGAHVAAEHLQRLLGEKNVTIDLREAEEAAQTGFIRDYGKKRSVAEERNQAIHILVDEVVDTASRLMDAYVRRLDGVIVAGGGARMVISAIKERWPHAVLADNARFAVAEGMRRFGMALQLAQADAANMRRTA